MLAVVHAHMAGCSRYRGPGCTRAGWPSNPTLDPVVADYRRIRPWRPCITYDGLAYRYFTAAAPTTQRIREAVICEYTEHGGDDLPGAPVLTVRVPNPTATPDATDRLYAFEGGTGSIDQRPHAWGLMGIVLERDAGDGDYDVHIAFRGSQSGSAYRAAFQGFVLEAGNADWVTDMEILKLVEDERFSPHGRVVRGIRDSTASGLGSLGRCLEDIHESRGRPPTRIHLAGHSLGGALAVQAAAALTVGTHTSTLSPALRQWPWPDLELITYGAPKAGDLAFAEHFDRTISATRVWVDGDPITEFPRNAHVGEPIALPSALSGTVTHEPTVIRRALVDRLRWHGLELDGVPEGADEPWQDHPSLATALMAAEAAGHTPRDLVGVDDEAAVDLFVELAGEVIETRSSYKMPLTKTRLELRRRRRKLDRLFADPTTSIDELRGRLRRFRGVQPGSTLEDHLRRVLIVREAARNGWSASDLLDDATIARALGSERWAKPTGGAGPARAVGPAPNAADIRKVKLVTWMRIRHHRTVDQGTVKNFRRRVVPISGMPHLVPACSKYPAMRWAPKDLIVPDRLPPEARLPRSYVLRYYGLGKLGWALYNRSPVRPDVPWDPGYEWNHAFPPTGDGWEHPTSDETFTRLRLQGPNPWLLRQVGAGFELDFTQRFAGILPPIVARFAVRDGSLEPTDITVGNAVHHRGDPTWDRAKRVVNAADARFIPFGRHLLDVHFIVGQAFALSTYSLPTWHPLRPFMQFFTYGTLQVNDFAYKALVTPGSYFVASGFVGVDDARQLFLNGIAQFELDQWIAPRDIAQRGLADIPDHPYVEDALLVWPAFVEVVERHLDDLRLDDETIAADNDLQAWYFTLAKVLPNTEPHDVPLDRARLSELCTALLWNNVVHEICGDLSPILGSEDPEDRAITNLERLRAAVGDGRLTTPVAPPTMGDVFLMDQASYTSRFNVGGNSIVDINAARWVDDPRLRDAIIDLQHTLRRLDAVLVERNQQRPIRFARMLPGNWEASISF